MLTMFILNTKHFNMRNCQRFCAIVIGMQSIVSNIMYVDAAPTMLRINNCTSTVFGQAVTLLCEGNFTNNRSLSAVTISRLRKTEIERIAKWTARSQELLKFVPGGRNWTVAFDNITGNIHLYIHDLTNEDSGIYLCDTSYNDDSRKNWLNLTHSDQYESQAKTTHYGILETVPSKIGFIAGIVGIAAISSGLIFAYYKRKVWLPKLTSKRNRMSCQEEVSPIERITYLHNLISECIRVVEIKGINTEGIYRLSCPQCELTKARQEIKRDIKAVCSLPVLTVSNVLKMVLRELSPPLIGEDTVIELLGANALITDSDKCTRMKYVLQQQESSKYNCLMAIFLHLRRIADNATVNMMTAENLAIVFAPSLLPTASSYSHLAPLDSIKAATEENNVKCQVIALLIKFL